MPRAVAQCVGQAILSNKHEPFDRQNLCAIGGCHQDLARSDAGDFGYRR